jgi:integrase
MEPTAQKLQSRSPRREVPRGKEGEVPQFCRVRKTSKRSFGREREGTEGPYVVAAIRLLALTRGRLNEILTLRWDYVDFERQTLWLPDSKSGRKPIFLSQPAIDVLANLPRFDGNPFVIVGGN